MKVINENKRLLFTLKEKTSGILVVAPEELILVEESTGGETPTPVDSRPYKVYTALLTQSGTDAPIAEVLENTLGVVPTFSYEGIGYYGISLNGSFLGIKTWQIMQNDAPTEKVIYSNGDDNLSIYVIVGDNQLNLQPIEIRVYNK